MTYVLRLVSNGLKVENLMGHDTHFVSRKPIDDSFKKN